MKGPSMRRPTTIAAVAVLSAASALCATTSIAAPPAGGHHETATYRGTKVTITNKSNTTIRVQLVGVCHPCIGHVFRPVKTLLATGNSATASEAGGAMTGGSVVTYLTWEGAAGWVTANLSAYNQFHSNVLYAAFGPGKPVTGANGRPRVRGLSVVPVDPQPAYDGTWTHTFGGREIQVVRKKWDTHFYLWQINVLS